MTPQIECSAVYPTLAVPDVAETCAWYVARLGFEERFLWGDPPTHGAITLGQACVHFWHGPVQLGENWLYFDVGDVEAMHQRALLNGVRIVAPPKEYPWGMREFSAVDLNGYNLRFGQNVTPRL